MNGVPPPVIHIHLRMFNVAADVPIGDLSKKQTSVSNGTANDHNIEVEIPTKEKEKFDIWLRELWQEKDQFITQFLKTGRGDKEYEQGESAAVSIPLRLHRKREMLDAFCFFLPAAAGYVWDKIRHGN